MSDQSEIRTARLVLRPPTEADADDIVRYCSDFDIAKMITPMPHPYARSDATGWIAHVQATPTEIQFAVTLAGQLIGACGYELKPEAVSAVFGYWIGRPFWGHGYATEVARALVKSGFEQLGVAQLSIGHMADNPASKNVILKCGFVPNGRCEGFSVARQANVTLLTYAISRIQAKALPWYQAA